MKPIPLILVLLVLTAVCPPVGAAAVMALLFVGCLC